LKKLSEADSGKKVILTSYIMAEIEGSRAGSRFGDKIAIVATGTTRVTILPPGS
jgi:hypothetical protein